MPSTTAFGRNAFCPCGSGLKYKRCCLGKKNWEQIVAGGAEAIVRNVSLRGKNIRFLNCLGAILQMDKFALENPSQFRKAFTGRTIQQIYEAILEIWPSSEDLARVLREERDQSSGLYVGSYSVGMLDKVVARHSIYCDTLLLVDPFTYPRWVQRDYNPLVYPEHYRAAAFQSTLLWLRLAPWIEAGIVRFIRTPGDLDNAIAHESHEIQTASFNSHPEIREISEQYTKDFDHLHRPLWEAVVILNQSDQEFTDGYLKHHPETKPAEMQKLLEYVRKRRLENPYYIEPLLDRDGNYRQLQIASSGTSYDMAKRVARLTGSHLITDLPTRWKEMEIDRNAAEVDDRQWSSFAKAFQNVGIHYLNDVPLNVALNLRREERLADMRGFLRKLWKAASPENSFTEGSAESLAAELLEKVREADDEWSKIDREVLKWLGGSAFASSLASMVSTGGAGWMAAAVGGVGSLLVSIHQRASFERRYPAGFFLKLKKANRTQ